MPVSVLAAFWLLSLLLIAVPGADWAFVLAAGVRSGRVGPAVAGLAVGYCALTALVAAGVGAAVAGSPAAMTVLTVAGGGYLVWYGVRTILAPVGGAAVAVGRSPFRQGIGVSGLNPKGLLLFLALLPQFGDAGYGWPLWLQLAVLGLTFVLTVVAFYLVLGALARGLLAARPAAAAWVTRGAGLGMAVVGAALLADRLRG